MGFSEKSLGGSGERGISFFLLLLLLFSLLRTCMRGDLFDPLGLWEGKYPERPWIEAYVPGTFCIFFALRQPR